MADGELTSSVLVTMPSVGGAQIWANAGVDLIAFDLEHGHIDLTTLHALIAATAGTDTVPVVRVPANVPWLVKQVLDVGAMGVVFPMATRRTLPRPSRPAGTHRTACEAGARSSRPSGGGCPRSST